MVGVEMWFRRIVLGFVALVVPQMANAQIEPPQIIPQEVVLYIDPNMPKTDFVDPLVCDLARTLVAPVRAEKLDLPVDSSLVGELGWLSAEKVLARLHQRSGPYAGTVVFLLLPYPVLVQRQSVFGLNFGPPYNKGVVSIATLAPLPADALPDRESEIIRQRAYKVILRYVGQIAGRWNSNGCVLAMPRGLGELDAKSSDFCQEDRATLVAAGVLKERPGGACTPIARHEGNRMVAGVDR